MAREQVLAQCGGDFFVSSLKLISFAHSALATRNNNNFNYSSTTQCTFFVDHYFDLILEQILNGVSDLNALYTTHVAAWAYVN